MLSVSPSLISGYRNSLHIMHDTIAVKFAEFLQLPPEYVLCCVAAERHAGTPAGDAWARVADSLAAAPVAA